MLGRVLMKTLAIMFGLLATIPAVSYAEIEKIAIPCETGLCFYWWPKLPAVKGWHYDRENSLLFSTNAQAPDGFTFKNSETVFYAKALYKPRIPDTNSLTALIEYDKRKFQSHDPTITITEAEALTTKDGKPLKVFVFAPKEKGNWELVAYGEEGEFYVVFTLSSRTKAGYTKNIPVFKQYVMRYAEKP